MATVTQPSNVTITLYPGERLDIVTDSISSGTVTPVAGDGSPGTPTVVNSSVTVSVGPNASTQRYKIQANAGTLTYNSIKVNEGAATPVYKAGPLAYAQLTVTTAATLDSLLAAASVPYTRTGAERWALVSVESNAIRWIDDNQAPTTSYGQPVASGSAEIMATDFSKVKLISQSGTATVNVSFYR